MGKEVTMRMILFTILLIIMAILTFIAIGAISIGGTAFILIFGDVIVCIVLIVLLMKKLRR